MISIENTKIGNLSCIHEWENVATKDGHIAFLLTNRETKETIIALLFRCKKCAAEKIEEV